MSPVPIIERQRALARIGEIHLGDEKKPNAPGQKLETIRLTSQHREPLDEAARLWGGTVKEWQSPRGPAWQIITETASIPVLVIVGYSLRRSYELWEGASKRLRVCDGEDEMLSGGPCLCNAEGKDACKIYTRLMVVIPELGTSLGWQLTSTGETAANELAGAMALAEGFAAGRTFTPAQLRSTQRRGALNGQATRFVVGVLDFNPQQHALAVGELPPAIEGYKPLASIDPGVSVKDGLEIVESQTVTRTSRSAAPIPAADDLDFGGPVPVPEEPGGPLAPNEPDDGKVTADQKGALNALHGELTRDKAITTEQVYAAAAKMRAVDVDEMIVILDGRKQNGDLSFAKLRDSLTKVEASNLIDRLGKLADNVKAGAAA